MQVESCFELYESKDKFRFLDAHCFTGCATERMISPWSAPARRRFSSVFPFATSVLNQTSECASPAAFLKVHHPAQDTHISNPAILSIFDSTPTGVRPVNHQQQINRRRHPSRYSLRLEINDPSLPQLVRRTEAGRNHHRQPDSPIT